MENSTDELKKGIKCKQCGSTSELIIHNLYTPENIRRSLEKEIIHELIKKSIDNRQIPFKWINKLRQIYDECGYINEICIPKNDKPTACYSCKVLKK